MHTVTSVSYTHLDVYKRQTYECLFGLIQYAISLTSRRLVNTTDIMVDAKTDATLQFRIQLKFNRESLFYTV